MNDPNDPFTGTWVFNHARSQLSTPLPRTWIQRIRVSDTEVSVREEIQASDGHQGTVVVQARFDGQKHPVTGSPLADAITYQRVDRHTIAGTGTKGEIVTLKETLAASPDGDAITLTYSIYAGTREVAKGAAIFEKQ